MILIISGPQGSGKTTIARMMEASIGGVKLYDEIPPKKPADFPKEGFVILTTNTREFPSWLHDTNFVELSTIKPQPIQQILETLPPPGGFGEQFSIFLSRLYPADSPNRFVVRAMQKNFTGNDVAELLLEAKAYVNKRLNRRRNINVQPGNDY